MPYQQAKPAASAASVALIALCLCVGALLPPFFDRVVAAVPLLVALGLGIAVSLVLHLIFVGMAARRLGRHALPWALLALLTLPIGSIVGLILFEWFAAQAAKPSSSGAA